MKADQMLTIQEAADVACVARTAIRNAIAANVLPHIYEQRGPIFRVTLIRHADAEAFTYKQPARELARVTRVKARRASMKASG